MFSFVEFWRVIARLKHSPGPDSQKINKTTARSHETPASVYRSPRMGKRAPAGALRGSSKPCYGIENGSPQPPDAANFARRETATFPVESWYIEPRPPGSVCATSTSQASIPAHPSPAVSTPSIVDPLPSSVQFSASTSTVRSSANCHDRDTSHT